MEADGLPLCRGPLEQRSLFIEKQWMPFLSELRDAMALTKTRYATGFSAEEVMPPRESWIAWADRNRELTAIWYGRPNVSVLYEFLIECSMYDGDSVYRTPELRQEWSKDGWARCIDGRQRKASYKIRDELKAKRTYALSQKAGESMIDNTVLPNVMTAAESHVLLAGKLIMDFTVRWHAQRQRKCLVALAKLPSVPQALGLLPTEKLREVLGALSDEDIAAAGVNPSSSALQTLRTTGLIVSSSGQFTTERRAHIQEFLQKMLGEAPADHEHDELDDFVEFIRAHPGRIYQDDSHRHHTMLQSVLFSKRYVIVKRSTMAHFTAHRYFSNAWERTYPLIQFDEEGAEQEIRPAGAEEFSRFRKNDFPYQDSHGMSISSGGLAESSAAYGGLAYELGVSLAMDGSAKIGNWFASDFEKILNEVVALNPAGGIDELLPGECFHDACQNPRCSSSIRETEHVQISRGSSSTWPLMRLEQKPMAVPVLKGNIDIVQVGSEPDAFHLCLESKDIAAAAIVSMFQELRILLYRKLGGQIDFILLAAPRGDGWFRASFVPVAAVKSCQQNVLTGEEISAYNLPFGVLVDSTSGKGNLVILTEEGWAPGLEGASCIRRVYDFNRMPGSRAIVAEFLKTQYGYIDDSAGMCLTLAEAVVPNGGLGLSLIDTLFPVQN